MTADDVDYYFYRPVFRRCECTGCGHEHQTSIGRRYYKLMRDRRVIEVSKREYDERRA